jgi:hypothetical protein
VPLSSQKIPPIPGPLGRPLPNRKQQTKTKDTKHVDRFAPFSQTTKKEEEKKKNPKPQTPKCKNSKIGKRKYSTTDPDPDNPPHLTPRRLQHSLDIRTATRRLLRHTPLNQLALGIGGDLARHPDLRRGLYGLRVRAGGCREWEDKKILLAQKKKKRRGVCVREERRVKGREGVRVCNWTLCLRGQALLVKTGVRSLGPGIFF